MSALFKDRIDAGRALAERLEAYAHRSDVVILALPRGGVPVGYEIATRLHAILDIFLVRKIGAPGHEEFAVGAISSGGVRVLNEDVIDRLGIDRESIDRVIEREERELERRERAYGKEGMPVEFSGRTVILVDDGLATGSSMRAAAAAVKRHHPARVVIAVPVAPPSTCEELAHDADEIVCLKTPEPFFAVGQWYVDFSQTTDDEVKSLLAEARLHHEPAGRTEP